MASVGSILELKIDSDPYNVVSDSDFSVKTPYETTNTPTSGGSIISTEKKSQDVESVMIDASDSSTYDAIEALQGKLVSVSFTQAGGQVFTSPACAVSMGDYSTMKGQLEITLMPTDRWIKS